MPAIPRCKIPKLTSRLTDGCIIGLVGSPDSRPRIGDDPAIRPSRCRSPRDPGFSQNGERRALKTVFPQVLGILVTPPDAASASGHVDRPAGASKHRLRIDFAKNGK